MLLAASIPAKAAAFRRGGAQSRGLLPAPTTTDLAYLAGLFDGEGHIGFYTYKATKNGRRYARLVMGITNTCRPVLEWVREVIGAGRIQRKRVRDADRSDCYSFIIQGLSARATITLMLPYLKVKHEQH